jgi:endonuclease/exonuclease/phosphatase family metal-dependent hydrolase
MRSAALVLALLLAGCGSVNYLSKDGPFYAGGHARLAPQPDASLRLVSYNIKYAREVRLAARELRRPPLLGADVVALQEMDSKGVEQIAAALDMNYVYYPSTLYRGTKREFGNAILSPWPIESPKKLVLPHRGFLVDQLRTATVATVQVEGRPLRVYSLHLGAPPMTTGGRRRRQMDVILDDAAASPFPVVLLGDFNHLGVARYAADHGYNWHTQDVGPSLGGPLLAFRFDHILTRGLPLPCCAEAGVERGAKASDHKPVWVALPLP